MVPKPEEPFVAKIKDAAYSNRKNENKAGPVKDRLLSPFQWIFN